MILNASEYNEEDELNSMNIEETMDFEQDEIEEEQEVSDAKDEELDDETDQVDTAIGTARGEIEFDYHKGMYKLDGSFSITNFASEQVTEPWIAFAVPENVLIAEDLPSGVEAVYYEGKLFIAVKLPKADESETLTRSEVVYLIGEGYDNNPNDALYLAEYTDLGFVFHNQLMGQREINFDVIDGIPTYDLDGNLTGSTTFDQEERNYNLNIIGEVRNNLDVDLEDIYVSFTVPEDIAVLESDANVVLLDKEDGTTQLAIHISTLQAGASIPIAMEIPVVGHTDTLVEATTINLYKVLDSGYLELGSFPGSIEIDLSEMDQEWTFDGRAQIVKGFPDVAENQFGLRFAFDAHNLTIYEVDEVLVEFDVPETITVHAPDEYTLHDDIPNSLKDFLESGDSSGNLDIEWDGNKAIIQLDTVAGTQWTQGYFSALGESTEPIESLEGHEVIVTLLKDGSEIVEQLTIPFSLVSYDDGDTRTDPEETADLEETKDSERSRQDEDDESPSDQEDSKNTDVSTEQEEETDLEERIQVIDSKDENNHSQKDNHTTVQVVDKENEDKENKGYKLPATATSNHNILFVGTLFLIAGGVSFLNDRRKNIA